MSGLLQDVRYALRQLRKRPGFTTVAVITLALGIGANTAVFSALNGLLLRKLPIPKPQELFLFGKGEWVGSVNGIPNRSWQLFSYPFFREFRQQNQAFSDVAAVSSILYTTHGRVAGGAQFEKVNAELVSGSYFNTLGVRPVLGRVLADRDDLVPGGHPLAVISYQWWQRRFGKSPAVLGQTVTISSTMYTIIGVAPREFFGLTLGQSPEAWIPLAMEKQISPGWNGLEDNLFQSLYLFGRLKPGVTLTQAGTGTNLVFKRILRTYAGAQPDTKTLEDIQHAEIELTPAATGLSQLRHQFSSPLKILMGVVVLVLLVACANVANLLLAWASAREREIAVRLSLGAPRSRVIRHLLLESGALALAGALLGTWLAWWATQLLLQLAANGASPNSLHLAPDARVLAFTFITATFTALFFGTAPALKATRLNLISSLKESRGATSSNSHSPLARGLIVGQVAVSLVLLVGTGLFLRTLLNLTNVDSGFNKKDVLITGVDFVGAGYQPDERLSRVTQRIEQKVDAIPGVKASSFAMFGFNSGAWTTDVAVPGRQMSSNQDPIVDHNIVGDGYFEGMGMPIILGRSLSRDDTAQSRRVAVINETMARSFFPGASPIGRTFSIGNDPAKQAPEWLSVEVVGVVKDAKYQGLDETQMAAAFYPHSQHHGFFYTLLTRYDGDSKTIASAITKAIGDIDPNLPLGEFTTLSQVVDDSVVDHRVVADLCAIFGALAALLAGVGIYGLMSYGVTRRTSEFGIRIALGAQGKHVLRVVLREILVLVLLGVALGVAMAVTVSRLVMSFLYGLRPYDPLTVALAVLAMITVALSAGYFPARRAAKVDPIVALRYE